MTNEFVTLQPLRLQSDWNTERKHDHLFTVFAKMNLNF